MFPSVLNGKADAIVSNFAMDLTSYDSEYIFNLSKSVIENGIANFL